MSQTQSTPDWAPNPWSRAWRAEVPSSKAAVERLLGQIRNDMHVGAYTEAVHFIAPAAGSFHIVSLVDDGLYAVRGGDHLALKRAFARVLADAACAVEVQHVIDRSTTVAVEWADFTIEVLTARRRESGLGDFKTREERRPMREHDYPILHPNWKEALGRGWR